MKNEIFQVIKISLMIFISLIAIYFISSLFIKPKIDTDCSKIDNILGFRFDSCYDYGTNSVIFSVSKYSNNKINSAVKINFDNREFPLEKIPEFGKKEYYRYQIDENPINLTVTQFLRESDNICSESKEMILQPCSEEEVEPWIEFNSGGKVNVTINNSGHTGDSVDQGLVDKNRTFNLTCISEWKCDEWGDCSEGFQRRICSDENKCFYSTNMPELERKCNECKENWQCSWSECKDNITSPACKDLNNCGTEFNIPKENKCLKDQCVPDYRCSGWSECTTNYTLDSLSRLKDISGIKTRICEDQSGCMKNSLETEQCSIKMSIYSRNVIICGKSYIEIYSSSTDELLARIKNDVSGKLPEIGISLSSSDIECNLCQNGIKDIGETGIDCGGSCTKCKKQSYSTNYLSDLLDWLRNLI